MYPIDLSGKNGVVFGVANEHSIAWPIARILHQAGARLAVTYQNERFGSRVSHAPVRWIGGGSPGYCTRPGRDWRSPIRTKGSVAGCRASRSHWKTCCFWSAT